MAQETQTSVRLTGEVRQRVADALSELVNANRLAPEVFDEVGPRLLPEAYTDIQDWYAAPMPRDIAEACTGALRGLADEDRLTQQQSAQARAYLGILDVINVAVA